MAPTIVGTNVITEVEDVVVDTMAALTAFQTFTETANETAAKLRCFVEAFDEYDDEDELVNNSPYVMISAPEDAPQTVWIAQAKGPPAQFQCDFAFNLQFARQRPPTWKGNKQDFIREMKNQVGAVMVEFMDQSGLDDKFGSTEILCDLMTYDREDRKKLSWQMWDWQIKREANPQ